MTISHPAKFTDTIVQAMRYAANRYLQPGARILDPFAGVGTIHQLRPTYQTFGVELEPEWATCHPWTVKGDSRNLHYIVACEWSCEMDAIFTSPTYGNRMADHHNAKDASKRHTYRHTLGRALTFGNSGGMQWGDAYRQLHRDVYAQCTKVLKPGGLFVLNMSDHIRKGEIVPVTHWHVEALRDEGFDVVERYEIPTPRQRHGANGHLRVEHEHLIVMRLEVA